MAVPVANASGVIAGRFTIPAGIPAGAKRVTLRGVGGSFGDATFTGRGLISVQERRVVRQIDEYHVDPLAQTVTLLEGRLIGGVDLKFTARGGNAPVTVQIRSVQNGWPTAEVLAESVIPAAAIKTNGDWTRAEWPLLWIEPGREIAIVALTDDAEHALAVAELGKYDPTKGWITGQPYQIGVLLSSSNASTWTAHQERDLTFRLLAARFTETTRTVPLGSIAFAGVSDVIALAGIERPSADTEVTLTLTDPTGKAFQIADGQVVSLEARLSGQVAVTATLKGSATRSPLLFPGIQTILGKLKDTATYVSRQIAAGANVKASVTLECSLPGTSGLTVHVQDGAGNWQPLPLVATVPVGEGWEERTFTMTGLSAASGTRVRLTLNGSTLHRPRARKLRAVVT